MAKRTEFQIAIDDALTKRLNREQPVAQFLAASTVQLSSAFAGRPEIFFYLKGSAALRRYLFVNGISPDRINAVSAPSDWDTQLVIDPGLPPAQWFTVFREALKTITAALGAFEEQLPQVLGAVFGANTADALRKRIADAFGLEIAQFRGDQKFRNGAQNAPIPWTAIESLADAGTPDAILDLNIQAHSRAVLTTPFIHPAQPLANLNAIWTGEQSTALAQERRNEADEAWTQMNAVTDEYDAFWMQLIATPEVVKELKTALTVTSLDAAFLSELPPDVVRHLIEQLHDDDQATRIQLWAGGPGPQAPETRPVEGVSEAWGRRLAAGETASAAETRLARLLAEGYGRTQAADTAQRAVEALKSALGDPAVLRAVADHHLAAVKLPRELEAALAEAWNEVERRLTEYGETGDPEEEAEAVKRDTEALAPFALVEQGKGNRKTASVLENMTIPDFYLFRLMIKAQFSNAPENRVMPAPSEQDIAAGLDFDTLKQQFKFRAELLDVSVPRHDSLETAEQWAHVRTHIGTDTDGVPLPDGSYFLDEYILMFREVLDRNSSSVHKLTKRYQRACLIAEAYASQLGPETLAARVEQLAARHPVFGSPLRAAMGTAGPANVLVLTRVFEQLVDSYLLDTDLKLQRDSAELTEPLAPQVLGFLTGALNAAAFENLMKTYATLGAQIYNRSLVLAGLRNRNQAISEARGSAVEAVAKAIASVRTPSGSALAWARMDEFVIAEQPRVPHPVKQELALDAMRIVVYPEDADQAKALGHALHEKLPYSVLRGDSLYIRLPQRSEAAEESPDPAATEAPAVVAKIEFVVTDPPNRLVPRYPQDLDTLVKAYRRTLPAYSEYYALSRKKRILKGLENAMATFL